MAETLKILLIDDSEDDRFLYRRTLKAAGGDYEFIEVDSGEKGLAFLETETPACVLLDYSLPNRNGIEILKRIRCKHEFVPVVMLTGQGNEAVAVEAMREGAQYYISKGSITPENLQRTMRVAIEHCAMQEHIHEQRASLEMFTRALAHDLKEPVRTIRSFLELIMRQNLPPDKTQKYFDYIQQAAERMGALIDTVYFYMRLDNANQQIATEACDSGQALQEAQQNIAALIKERGAVITADKLPVVDVNHMQLIQLMQNLLSNAIYHCETEPEIHVSASRDEGGWLFRVSDNGPGIADEYRERIFEPFKRLARHRDEGLGLGLAICKKIVTGAGGKIWCEAAEPHGATFCFTFADAGSVIIAGPAAAPLAAETRFWVEEGRDLATILLVEDSEADIELIRFALAEEHKVNCRLTISRNGHEAIARLNDRAEQALIDLILLDINMPGMDGFELLTRLRASKAQPVPVVMCTTSTYDRDIAQAKALGAAGYMIKPFDFVRLRPYLAAMPGLRCSQEEEGYTLTRVSAA